jgi:hypothetical protein
METALKQIPGAPQLGQAPRLAHDLDFVFTKKGPHLLPRPWPIAHAQKFDMRLLKPYRKASEDETLSSLASLHSLSYSASTSSITSALALLHSHLLQSWTLNTQDFFSTPLFSRGYAAPVKRLSDAVAIDIVPRKSLNGGM